MYLIYLIKNLINKKVYIGRTSRSLHKRKLEHLRAVKYLSMLPIHCAIRKYGINNFEWENVAFCESLGDVNFLEKFFISQYKTKSPFGYNLTDGGEGTIGIFVSSETREKIRKGHLGKKLSDAHKELIRIANTGKHGHTFKHTEEAKKKIGIASLGNKHNIGYRHSEETKEKHRQLMLGNKNPNFGVKYWGINKRRNLEGALLLSQI